MRSGRDEGCSKSLVLQEQLLRLLRNNPAAAAAAHSTAAAAAGFSSDGSRSSSVHILGNDTVKSADEERASDGWPNETIFISMASYRDQECSKTVARAYLRAAHPHRVFFGIYQQQYTHTRAHIHTHTHTHTRIYRRTLTRTYTQQLQ